MVIKYPCLNCEKACKSNQNCILCDICNKWLQLRCTNISLNDFLSLGASNIQYFCPYCIDNIFSFQTLSNNDLQQTLSLPISNNSSTAGPEELEKTTCPITSDIIQSKLNYPTLEELHHSSKYYSPENFQHNVQIKNKFSILHLNI